MTTDERIADIKDWIDAGIDIPHYASVWMFEALSTLTAQRDEAIGHVRALDKEIFELQYDHTPASYLYESPPRKAAKAFLATVPKGKADTFVSVSKAGQTADAKADERYTRHGKHLFSMALSLGWSETDEEGPFEYWTRLTRQTALEDAAAQIAEARNAALDEAVKAVETARANKRGLHPFYLMGQVDAEIAIRALKTQTDGATE